MTSSTSEFLNRPIPNTLNWVGKFRLTAGILACAAVFEFAGRVAGIPAAPGMGGSLLVSAEPSTAIGAVGLALIVCTLIGKFIVGDLLIGNAPQAEGGLMAALIGMAWLALKLGSVRYAYFAAAQPSVGFLLAVEVALLYVVVAFCWLFLQWAGPAGGRKAERGADRASVVAMHVLVMGASMMFFAASDEAGQGLAAVAISAALASMVASSAFDVNSSGWYLIGPAVVGIVGYLSICFSPDGLAIGYPTGMLGALVRPTPLAYAAAGPAGAIFGHWIALGWRHGEAA